MRKSPILEYLGSIPAWAGETHKAQSQSRAGGVYPRVGGGNAPSYSTMKLTSGLSPRGRGKRVAIRLLRDKRGSIPAWAGETRCRGCPRYTSSVYPRVGGGNPSRAVHAKRQGGLSPRGRGKPARRVSSAQLRRSIPAWAGETIASTHSG